MGLIAGFVLMSLFLFSIWTPDQTNQATRFYTVVIFSLIVAEKNRVCRFLGKNRIRSSISLIKPRKMP